MKVFVTVGTTPFDSLVRSLDREASADMTFQIADGVYTPSHHNWFRFSGSVEKYYASDIIICHAGAGTVYPLLESGRSIVVVPNLEREDKHQLELYNYLKNNNYCMCVTVEELADFELNDFILSVNGVKRDSYCKDDFFAVDEILSYFDGRL